MCGWTDFTEMMKTLGYSRLISMENFRNPNFPLVAEILTWLVKCFDPNADIPKDIETESDRISLIRAAVQFLATNANIRLNTKRLYQADGYAVKEMLKVTTILYDALKEKPDIEDIGNPKSLVRPFTIYSKLEDLKKARSLSTELTSKGAVIYDLLGKEAEMRDVRAARITRQLDMTDVQSAVNQAIEIVKSEINNTKQLINNVSASEASLDSKIEKKRLELERNEKRLQTLKKVRPAFMEEFEKLEVELKQLYQDYVTRFRNLSYLDQLMEDADMAEQERMEERQAANRKMLEQMKQDDKFLESATELGLGGGDAKDEKDDIVKLPAKTSRVRIQTASRVMRKASARRVFGNMSGPADDDDDDDSGSLDSDTDLLLDGDGSEILGSEEEEEEELELGGEARPKQIEQHSDDDF